MSSLYCSDDCDEGKIHYYFINTNSREVGTDWAYCSKCFPGSTSDLHYDNLSGWKRCTLSDYVDLVVKRGYIEHNF